MGYDPDSILRVPSLTALASIGLGSGSPTSQVVVDGVGQFNWVSPAPGTPDGQYFVAATGNATGCWALQFPTTNLTPVGSIFSASTFTSLAGFTTNGTTPTVSGGKINFSGGTGSFTKSLDYDYYTQADQWTQTITEVAPTPNTTSIGLGIGIRSYGQFSKIDVAGLVYLTSGGAHDGHVAIQDGGSLAALSTTTLAFSAGDIIQVSVTRSFNVITVSANNISTQSAAVSVSYTYLFTDGETILLPNLGKFAIYNFGGTVSLSSYTILVDSPKGVNALLVGDSKLTGYYAGSYSNVAGNLIQNTMKVSIQAGGGDTTADVLLNLPEIIARRPQSVVLNIGRNDLGNAVSLPTIETNYTSIVNQLEAAGIIVFNLLPLYETAVDQSALTAWILATFPASNIISSSNSTYPMIGQEYANPASNVLAADGVHPNTFDNRLIARAILVAYQPFLCGRNYQSYYDFLNIQNIQNGNLTPPTGFTPTLSFGGASVGITGTQVAQYTIWNSQVNFLIRIFLSSKGSSTGAAIIQGPPPKESTGIQTPCIVVPNSGFDSSVTNLVGLLTGNSNTIKLYKVGAGGVLTQLDNTDFTNTTDVFVFGSYYTMS